MSACLAGATIVRRGRLLALVLPLRVNKRSSRGFRSCVVSGERPALLRERRGSIAEVVPMHGAGHSSGTANLQISRVTA